MQGSVEGQRAGTAFQGMESRGLGALLWWVLEWACVRKQGEQGRSNRGTPLCPQRKHAAQGPPGHTHTHRVPWALSARRLALVGDTAYATSGAFANATWTVMSSSLQGLRRSRLLYGAAAQGILGRQGSKTSSSHAKKPT